MTDTALDRITDAIVDSNLALDGDHRRRLDAVSAELASRGIEVGSVLAALRQFSVATPSWALGTGSTRFGRFPRGGEPRDLFDKLDDAAALNLLTGSNRSVSLHVPWDLPDDPEAVRAHAGDRGLTFDAMNSNTFQDDPSTTDGGRYSYKFGSLAHTDDDVRAIAVEHNRAVIDLGVALGSTALTVWLADGTNHPGQADFRGQFERVAGGLAEIHDHLPAEWTLLVEHKPYEPAFYSSVNADWGSSYLLATHAGDRARCLVDLGHHLPGTNIEQVVSRLGMTGRLGGFHFNDSKYGDDDLTAGSINPFQLFLVFVELTAIGAGALPDLYYMIDESHNVKDPLEDLAQSTDALQLALAQALALPRAQLADAQHDNDPARAADLLNAAYRLDLTPLVAEARRLDGGAVAPLAAYRASGYRDQRVRERGMAAASGTL